MNTPSPVSCLTLLHLPIRCHKGFRAIPPRRRDNGVSDSLAGQPGWQGAGWADGPAAGVYSGCSRERRPGRRRRRATPSESPEARQYDEQVRPFLARHCQECHGGEKPKGDFRLDRLTSDFHDTGQPGTVAGRAQAAQGGRDAAEGEAASAGEGGPGPLRLDRRPGGMRRPAAAPARAGRFCGGSTGSSMRTPSATSWAWTSI